MTPHDFLQVGGSSGVRSEAPCNTLAKPCQQSNGRHGDFHLKKGRSKWVNRPIFGTILESGSRFQHEICNIVDTPMCAFDPDSLSFLSLKISECCQISQLPITSVFCSARTLSHMITCQLELLVIDSSLEITGFACHICICVCLCVSCWWISFNLLCKWLRNKKLTTWTWRRKQKEANFISWTICVWCCELGVCLKPQT